ncbi:MAG: S-adenosyl-l-methionine hydroxide adenosyltransferase family protein [Acidimicrobiales bacterium]
MPLRYETVTFLSDYGLDDEFVGVVKSVIRQIAPGAEVIDLTHQIPPHDVRAGALLLARSAQYLCPGVVLAVVDPEVGGERRAIAVEVGDGQSVLVGPDNGLLAPAVGMVGGASRAVELTNPEFQLPTAGATFAGRDVFAPAAAHLCAGVELAQLGPSAPVHSLRPGIVPLSRREAAALVGEALWVDRFGNVQLNVDPEEAAQLDPERLTLQVGERRIPARLVAAYAELRVGEVGLVVDSYGLLSVAVNRGAAADELNLRAGDLVTLTAPEGEPGASSPVTLRRSGPRP